MGVQPGERVGAISHTDGDTIFFYGYGVYVGMFIPTIEEAGDNEMLLMFAEARVANPRINLDDGGVVWGMTCWWGAEEWCQSKLSQYVRVMRADAMQLGQTDS